LGMLQLNPQAEELEKKLGDVMRRWGPFSVLVSEDSDMGQNFQNDWPPRKAALVHCSHF
jgi:hypothetical protein